MRSVRSPWLAAALLAALGAPAAVSATVLQELTLEDMAADADAVVLGTVVRVEERLASTPRGLEPQRIATVRVERWLKGRGAQRLTVRERGGPIGRSGGMAVAGTPRYRAGQQLLLFLARHPEHQGAYRTYAMAQGFFVVLRGVPGTPDTVRRDLRDVGLARWSQGRFEVFRRDGVEVARLEDVLRRIAEVVRWIDPAAGEGGEVTR